MAKENRGIQGFIEELRRRRVFRVAAVYLGSAFVLLEASEMIFPRMGLPDWTVSFVLGVLALGFPIAVILAWAFEVTPDGLNRARNTNEKQTTAEKPLTSNMIIIGLLTVIAILLAYPQFTATNESNSGSQGTDPKSIAVLPFTSFSESKDSENFSDGMTDVILTQLAKISDLKVISRTSIMQYKGTEKPIKMIAQELGVAHVLEGSVQRAGDQVRIVSQLIKADSDEHLWAETYDRNYADIFSVQSDVARAIASAMQATLTPEEETYLDKQPTENQEAWDLYMQAKILLDDFTQNQDDYMELLGQAADLDPDFILPRVYLVRFLSNNYFNRREPIKENLNKAKQRLGEILVSDPSAPESHLAQGYYHYYASLKFEKALEEFTIAQNYQPNNAELHEALAYINRRLGNWEAAYENMLISTQLDPNAGGKIAELLQMSFQLRKWDRLAPMLERLLLMDPDNAPLRAGQVVVRLASTGSFKSAHQLLDSLANIHSDGVLYQANRMLTYMSRDFQSTLEWTRKDTTAEFMEKAKLYRLIGNQDSARVYYDSIRVRNERRLASSPPIYWMYTNLGIAHAGLGNRKEALKAAEKAAELTSMKDDAIAGTFSLAGQAQIYHLLGDFDKALDIYATLLEVPSETSIQFMILDPVFDDLREHPKYKALVRKYKPANWSEEREG
jgi:TolB-like protein/Flp pilus assembly protein TadD